MLGTMAVVSCGPSAAEYPGHEAYDVVVGARDIPARFECDLWTFCDWEVAVHVQPIGKPVAFAKAITLEQLREKDPAAARQIKDRITVG